jgi:hypothetical protein
MDPRRANAWVIAGSAATVSAVLVAFLQVDDLAACRFGDFCRGSRRAEMGFWAASALGVGGVLAVATGLAKRWRGQRGAGKPRT